MIKLNNLKEAHEYFKKLTGKQIGSHIGNETKALWWGNCCLTLSNVNDFIQENPVNNKYFPVRIFKNTAEFEKYLGIS